MAKTDLNKVILTENEIPKFWYNALADLPEALDPYISPNTMQPVTPDELRTIFPDSLIEQETTTERFIEIPAPIREMYGQFRPSPLVRARALEKLLDTPARLYYKYEGGNATGSHKLNSAIAQAYYNKEAGITRLTTETGAGQWGSALSMACKHFGMECTIYMVRVSMEQKPYRKILMETFGGEVFASPSTHTAAGRKVLASDPDCTGSLGIAITEAVEDAAGNASVNYSLGSVLNHVVLHQTIIGEEAKVQFERFDDFPDMVIACTGGGTNFGGIAMPFYYENVKHGKNIRLIGVEPASCPSFTKGAYAYDYADLGRITPILKMYTLGHEFIPSGIHAGGLRFHGMSPILSKLYNKGLMEARAEKQLGVFAAALQFANAEGIVPAPESSHAIKAAIDEALVCKESGESKAILFNVSGNGYMDMAAYERYISGKIVDTEFDMTTLEENLKRLPEVDESAFAKM